VKGASAGIVFNLALRVGTGSAAETWGSDDRDVGMTKNLGGEAEL